MVKSGHQWSSVVISGHQWSSVACRSCSSCASATCSWARVVLSSSRTSRSCWLLSTAWLLSIAGLLSTGCGLLSTKARGAPVNELWKARNGPYPTAVETTGALDDELQAAGVKHVADDAPAVHRPILATCDASCSMTSSGTETPDVVWLPFGVPQHSTVLSTLISNFAAPLISLELP